MTSIKQKPKIFFLQLFNICLCITIVLGGIYYLVSVNDLAIKGFSLQYLKDQASAFASENQDLELSVMSLQSYGNIDARAKEMNMVAVGNIEYITLKNNVAKK